MRRKYERMYVSMRRKYERARDDAVLMYMARPLDGKARPLGSSGHYVSMACPRPLSCITPCLSGQRTYLGAVAGERAQVLRQEAKLAQGVPCGVADGAHGRPVQHRRRQVVACTCP